MSPLNPADFDLLTFDCYGTLVDWEAGILTAARTVCESHHAFPSDAALLNAFAEFEHSVQAEKYRPYKEILAITLGRMGEHFGFTPGQAEKDHFGSSVGTWPPFTDSTTALKQLARYYRLGIVSNVDDDLFAQSRQRLGVNFDWVVTAEQVKSYKPAPAHFQEMTARSGIPRKRTLHIAQSLFHDIGPASSLGYTTVHVDRPSRVPGSGATPPAAAHPDLQVRSMEDVAKLLCS